MPNSIKFLISLVVLALLLIAGVSLAQTDVSQEVSQDENIQSEDLGVGESSVLPDSPFYFFKNIGRGIESIFTFNPIAKAELKLKFSSQKLLEAKKLAEKNKKPEILTKSLENYKTEVENLKTAADNIKEKARDNPKINTFLDKFVKQQILHQKILQKLETQVPPQVLEKIQETRAAHLERFGEVITKLEDRKEEIQARLEKGLEEIKGSEFKDFKNLEILKELEEKAPEAAKEAIQKAQENSLKRLQAKFEQMPPEQQEKFGDYVEKVSGNKEKQIEIIENLRGELRKVPAVREKLLDSRGKILEKIEVKDCPKIEKPSSDFCKDGRVVVNKNTQGCITAFNCLIPGEFNKAKTACITLWDPVCGKDRRTYSNKCFARAAGVEIASPGECGAGR